MLTSTPGGGYEPGYIGFAIADALLDVLVEKGVISIDDTKKMLHSVAKKLRSSHTDLGGRCAKHIMIGMPG